MKRFSLLFLLVVCSINLLAQDTVVVQTLTFDSTWTRRGKWVFPPATEKYRKILMYHTLKCFPGVSGDGKYACGEWDYLTYTFVYDKKGLLDSTYQSRYNYTVGGGTPDSLPYTTGPVYDFTRLYKKYITRTSTTSLDTVRVGQNIQQDGNMFGVPPAGRSQYLWRATELQSAGLTAGNLTGLRFWVTQPGKARENLVIKMKQTSKDSLTPGLFEDTLITVFNYRKDFITTGWVDFQFLQPFAWNGTSNLVIEISYQNGVGGGSTAVMLQADAATSFGSAVSAYGNDFAMSFSKSGDFLDLGRTFQTTGNSPRTIEVWAKVNAFNDGGLFQAGATGATAQDFSLRTTGTANIFRAQTWGTTDYDVTLNGNAGQWHHYALSYDGTVLKVYYDGKLAGTKAAVLSTGNNNVWLGRWAGSYFSGELNNFRYWNKALNDSVINSWYRRVILNVHPDYNNLKADYRFDEGTNDNLNDNSPSTQPAGKRMGSSWWSKIAADQLFFNAAQHNVRPVVLFEKGVYTSKLDSVMQLDSTRRAPLQVISYNNPAPKRQVPDNSPVHPNLPTDTMTVWAAGYSYTFNASGAKVDSMLILPVTTLRKTLKEWYSPNVTYEIGRFITPYGINLNMGNGFRWVYDVTDYAQLLHDTVDLAAGNNQELIDVKFLMIKGEPPAEVNRIVHLSDKGAPSYSYKDLAGDKYLKAQTIDIKAGTEVVRVKTRLTGHGQNSTDGNYPHCCEWKDNTHYLYANGTQVAGWKIFRYTECAENPLYPQGGTWPGAREGWCPGDKVQEYEFDVSDKVSNGKITLDYGVDPVPADNLGMGNGNYVISMHVIEYKQPKLTLDGEMYEIVAPNNYEYYSRKNPICIEPNVVVRNAGSTTLTSITISYGISGGPQKTYTWVGSLKFLELATFTLPITDGSIWVGDGSNKFTATITKVNGVNDANTANNTANTYFALPTIFPGKIIVNTRTNNVPAENKLTVRDVYGATIFTRQFTQPATNYFDTLNLGAGCYTLELSDEGQDGLSYWANPTAGNGLFRIRSASGALLKAFNPDFGGKVFFAFGISQISNVTELQSGDMVEVYPNPSNGQFTVMIDGLKGDFAVEVYNSNGQLIRFENVSANGLTLHPMQLTPAPGVYLVRVSGNEKVFTQKLIVN
jgi:hypothetical protein